MVRLLALVPLVGRGSLVHGTLGGETLADRAVALLTGLADDVVVVADHTVPRRPQDRRTEQLSVPADAEALIGRLKVTERVVVHDPLCPLVPQHFVRQLVEGDPARVRVGVRPVVDTVKATGDELITGTVDRERLRMVSSPLVAPGSLLAELGERLPAALSDLAVLVSALRQGATVELVVAPAVARRVEDTSGLRLLSAVDAVSHRTREGDEGCSPST
jgi:2-C-methyl-D-erythritol 4-phosphate cytidylyltransferase